LTMTCRSALLRRIRVDPTTCTSCLLAKIGKEARDGFPRGADHLGNLFVSQRQLDALSAQNENVLFVQSRNVRFHGWPRAAWKRSVSL
jgi:hypothetical protein